MNAEGPVGSGKGELKPRPLATDAAIRAVSPEAVQSVLGTTIASIRYDMTAKQKTGQAFVRRSSCNI